MDRLMTTLNSIIFEIYNNIMRVEELSIKRNKRINLSINELHMIEHVGQYEETGITVSGLARQMGISKPSTTVALKKLEKKGHVRKVECINDGRVVRIFLTKEGKIINAYHNFYHRNMLKEINKNFTEEEKNCLIKAIKKLNEYFKQSIDAQ